MDILLLRAALAPCVVLLISIAARRLGPGLGGRLLGAPTTTAPFVLLIALSSGPRAAAVSVHGSITGQLAVAVFCLSYGRFAARLRPGRTCLAALGCASIAELVGAESGSLPVTVALELAVIIVGLLTWPPTQSAPAPQPATGRFDWGLPARMALSGVTVFVAVSVADAAGPFLGGVLSSLPILLVIMSIAIHRSTGGTAAEQFARGALTTSLATVAFLLTLAVTLEPLGVLAAYALSAAAFAAADRLSRLFTSPAARRRRTARMGAHGVGAGLQ